VLRRNRATSIELHAVGAAIPRCLSLALAIADALPCGQAGVDTTIRTGSVQVGDEVVPDDDDEVNSNTYLPLCPLTVGMLRQDVDISYQIRVKSTVSAVLTLKQTLASLVTEAAGDLSGKDKARGRTRGLGMARLRKRGRGGKA
jgi:hypothetical protein